MKEEISKAVEILKNGGLILYPTDTVWGIGCDATDERAVQRIYDLKRSGDKKSMLVLLDSIDKVSLYTDKTPEAAWDIFELADKPTTLILPNAKGVAANLIPDERTLGIRIPDHEFCRQLIHRLNRPLVSTSANITGEKTPTDRKSIAPEIVAGVDYVVPERYEGDSDPQAVGYHPIPRRLYVQNHTGMIETKIQMRFADIDMFKHVNNVALQHYYDLGTRDYFRQVLGIRDVTGEHSLVKVHTSANYFAPIHMDDDIAIRTFVSRIGNRSITIRQELIAAGQCKSDCETVLAGFDSIRETSADILPEYKETIKKHESWQND